MPFQYKPFSAEERADLVKRAEQNMKDIMSPDTQNRAKLILCYEATLVAARELLKLYMRHVLEVEGVTFVEPHLTYSTVNLSEEQISELQKIQSELNG